MQRKPSHLGSYCQPAPDGSWATDLASIGGYGCFRGSVIGCSHCWERGRLVRTACEARSAIRDRRRSDGNISRGLVRRPARLTMEIFALRAQCGRDVRAPSIHFKYGSRLNRFCFDNKGAQRSPSFSIRLRTLSIRKSSMSMPRSISFHVTGVETIAFGVGRIE
jgi:hypothetical protein